MFSQFAIKLFAIISDEPVHINNINKNYYKDLKLEGLAQIFNYNSAYLGKLFKSETGMNFNTYLDTLRIEKAKKLLVKEKLKVYQVSEKVGYKS